MRKFLPDALATFILSTLSRVETSPLSAMLRLTFSLVLASLLVQTAALFATFSMLGRLDNFGQVAVVSELFIVSLHLPIYARCLDVALWGGRLNAGVREIAILKWIIGDCDGKH